PAGDAGLGAALLAQAAPLWFGLSLMAEFRQLAEQVLALDLATPAQALALHEAYGHALWHTAGADPATARSFGRALELAEQLGATAHRLRALWGLWLICNTNGDYAGSVSLAERFGDISARLPDPATRLTHERMMALGLHLHGQQARARTHAQHLLDQPVSINLAARNSGFQFDQRVAALTVMARTLWIHGLAEQALRCAEAAVEEALSIGHALSLCYAVANGCAPVAFWAGDLAMARRFNELLLARAGEHSLAFWQAFGEGYALLLREGAPRASLRELTHPAQSLLLLETMCTVQPHLMDERLSARADSGLGGWCAAELLRIRGEQGLTRAGAAWPDAEALFRRAQALAEGQQALAWALRAALSLARLARDQDRRAAARATLEPVLARFTEGFDGPDLRAADQLLRSL
ncbi:MAG TPA: hypothetical protein VJN44_07470, partial [Roseateles sp.]|nr:hypothetical protein [Roseateles sp.]